MRRVEVTRRNEPQEIIHGKKSDRDRFQGQQKLMVTRHDVVEGHENDDGQVDEERNGADHIVGLIQGLVNDTDRNHVKDFFLDFPDPCDRGLFHGYFAS